MADSNRRQGGSHVDENQELTEGLLIITKYIMTFNANDQLRPHRVGFRGDEHNKLDHRFATRNSYNGERF